MATGQLTQWLWPDSVHGKFFTVFVVLATATVVKILVVKVQHSRRAKKFEVSRFTDRRGVLVLHQFSRGKNCPNLSPFALKLECYLRLSGFEYIVDSTQGYGPNGKCPWVNLESGEPMGDSQLIIEYLKLQETSPGGRGRVPATDKSLSPRERGVLRGVRAIAEDQLFWCVIYWRYCLDKCRVFLTTQRFPCFLNWAFPKFMVPGIRKKSKYQGIACHSPQDVYRVARDCCRALSDVLGDRPFFCGDLPGTEDCSVFGNLAQLMWNAPGTEYHCLITEENPRLAAYCNRMKETLYPDWNDLVKKPWRAKEYFQSHSYIQEVSE